MRYKAYYYLKPSGKSPLNKYLSKINDIHVLIAIEELIERLIESKCCLPSHFIKPIYEKIYELRLIQHGQNHRIFYFVFKKNKIILLDGYTKKTNKIPKRILKRVKYYYFDYINNKNERIYIRKNSKTS